MFGWLFKPKNPPDLDKLRNEAVAAWIVTFTVDSRLEAFLRTVPQPVREEVRRSAEAIYESTNAFLDGAVADGMADLESFHVALRAHLELNFPWMNESTFNTLCSYTRWLSWHDGYFTGK